MHNFHTTETGLCRGYAIASNIRVHGIPVCGLKVPRTGYAATRKQPETETKVAAGECQNHINFSGAVAEERGIYVSISAICKLKTFGVHADDSEAQGEQACLDISQLRACGDHSCATCARKEMLFVYYGTGSAFTSSFSHLIGGYPRKSRITEKNA